MVFMTTFSFLNQTLWCDPRWNRLSETIPMSGNIIWFGWEIIKLAFWKLSILDLTCFCCPEKVAQYFILSVASPFNTYIYTLKIEYSRGRCTYMCINRFNTTEPAIVTIGLWLSWVFPFHIFTRRSDIKYESKMIIEVLINWSHLT